MTDESDGVIGSIDAATEPRTALRGLGRFRLSSVLATLSALTLLTVGLALSAGSATASGPSVVVEVVLTNPDFELMAVDTTGVSYGISSTNDHGIWRSLDQGATWAKVLTLPGNQRVTWVSVLSSGTVLAHIDTGEMSLFRSADHGDSWTKVLAFPTTPVFNTTLTAHSVTDGDGHVWVGTYNISDPSLKYDNQIFRSDNDGATWVSVNTTSTHRHIHGLRFNTTNHKLYVFFGDSAGDGVWQSSDNGATLQPLCTVYECVTIDGAFGEDPSGGFLVFGQDNYTSQNRIVKVSLATGDRTNVLDLPYDSFSTYRLNATTYLVGTTHEGPVVPKVDPNLHLYISTDGADSFVDAFQSPILDDSIRTDLMVQSSYPNGDFPIQVDGMGTIIARLVTAPTNTAPPVVTGTPEVGATLSGSVGGWAGSTATYAVAWGRCNTSGASCSPIDAATALSYAPVTADIGKTLRLTVTASNAAGASAPVTSAPSSVIVTAPAPGGGGGGTGGGSNGGGGGGTAPAAPPASSVPATPATTTTGGNAPTSLAPRAPAASLGVTRTGTAKANVMIGTRFADLLRGLGGNDRISGLAGSDKLYGGPGNDTISGGLGKDLIQGGAGADVVNARDGQRDTIGCGLGADAVIADKADVVSLDCESVKRR